MGLVRIAYRNLAKRRLRSALTVAGIAVGVALVFSLLSITATAEQAAIQQFRRLTSYDIAVINGSLRQSRPQVPGQVSWASWLVQSLISEDVVSSISSIPEVYAVTPVLSVRGTVNRVVATIQGIVPQSYDEVTGGVNVVEGRMFTCYDCQEAVVGRGLAVELNANIGDRLVVSLGNSSGEVVVVGVFETGVRLQEMVVYVPLELLQEIAGLRGYVTQVLVKCRDTRSVETVAKSITSMFPGLSAVSMVAAIQRVEEAINTMTLFFMSIGLVALTAGGFGVMNTMFMAVAERTREIGVLKSIGATDRRIFALFLVESVLIGLIGSFAGLLVGVFFSRVIPSLLTLSGGIGGIGARLPRSIGSLNPVELAITPDVVLTSVAVGVLVAIVAGLLPAYRAAKMRPAEAMRYV